ncbi:cyanophycin synthetase [Clostridium sardiniense]|uniref:Cyanophycin synthetase n=1 Tax=Clostridium sardiniense TaxID=29369 RepID=A0ABS7KYW3_CLOSR|nr:cyanophycin synthetase [Clostridium sardiniense]MBY0755717.1 cyanophycin synthetase [Clostridium sardiniense]MDQ0460056.1 cyanophycin synthetase [Clostridium sardiniense]
MKIKGIRIFNGRNIYSHRKCMRMDVDLEGYSEIPSNKIEGFNDELLRLLPILKEHRCGIDTEGGFVIRLNEGTYLSHICEHIVIGMQNMLGMDVSYGKARECEGDHYYIIYEFMYENTAVEIGKLAVDLINSLITKKSINFEERLKLVSDILSKESIGPSTEAIKVAAERVGLPVFEIDNSGYYQIGYGKQGRIIEATIGSNTTCIGADIACDKMFTKTLLKSQSIPVADGEKVYNVIGLLKAAESIGYPVVLKPQCGNQGKGVFLNIKNEKELIKVYNKLSNEYKDIIIERYVSGNDYRVCVINNEVVAASLRIPPKVSGDGKRSISELIEELNNDPLRGDDHEKPLTKIKIDDDMKELLLESGYKLSSIPKVGEEVVLRRNANLSTGGMAIDCTDEICEENKRYCIKAAKIIGLDICGIDITALSIGEPIKEQGVVMEVNAAPGIRMHHYPSSGEPRDVGKAILNHLYNGKPRNIPVIAITGTNGKTTTTRLISYVLNLMGNTVGMTSTEGIYIGDECIDIGDDTGYESAKSILLNKDVDVAVLETARGGMIKKGLAYDLADVGVVTNITEDHLGLDEIYTMEDLSFIKSLVTEAVKPSGYSIINADDNWSRNLIDRARGEIIYFSKDKNNNLIQKNILAGKKAVFIDDGILCVVNNNKKYNVLKVDDIPITLNGSLIFNIENALAACAALVGIGIDYCMIARGFNKFKLDYEHNAGRFNMYKLNGRTIILDYGHNVDGFRAIFESLKSMNFNKLIGVIGIPGDRNDEMAIDIGKISDKNLDFIIIKEDIDKRGRKPGEIASLIENGISDKNKYKIVLEEPEALKEAIRISEEGDVIVAFFEELQPLMKVVESYRDDNEKEELVNL